VAARSGPVLRVDSACELLYGGRLTVVSPLEERCSWRRANSGGGGMALRHGQRLGGNQKRKAARAFGRNACAVVVLFTKTLASA
jgi:hypothetical protein